MDGELAVVAQIERAGLAVAPDFRFRLLTQLGNVETWDGEPARGLSYMEEARALLGESSLRQRAAFLPGGFASLEQGGEWGLGWVALFTMVWLVSTLPATTAAG